jgi:hypothetical protein
MQVNRDAHTFSSKNCMETKVHYAKTKMGIIHIPKKLRHSEMNEQSGFNVEQIKKDRYPEGKTI